MTIRERPSSDHSEEYVDLAAGYALGALPEADRARFSSHLSGCAYCRRLTAEYRATADLLPAALPEVAPAPDLRARILAAAAADQTSLPVPTRLNQSPTSRRRWVLPASAAAVLLALVGLTWWNLSLQVRLDEQAEQAALQQRALAAVAAGSPQWPLTGTEAAPESRGVLALAPDTGESYLVAQGLPELPEGQIYQAWIIDAGGPEAAGLLPTRFRGGGVLRLQGSLADANQVALTIEPSGGSPQPTGPIVLAGSL